MQLEGLLEQIACIARRTLALAADWQCVAVHIPISQRDDVTTFEVLSSNVVRNRWLISAAFDKCCGCCQSVELVSPAASRSLRL